MQVSQANSSWYLSENTIIYYTREENLRALIKNLATNMIASFLSLSLTGYWNSDLTDDHDTQVGCSLSSFLPFSFILSPVPSHSRLHIDAWELSENNLATFMNPERRKIIIKRKVCLQILISPTSVNNVLPWGPKGHFSLVPARVQPTLLGVFLGDMRVKCLWSIDCT